MKSENLTARKQHGYDKMRKTANWKEMAPQI